MLASINDHKTFIDEINVECMYVSELFNRVYRHHFNKSYNIWKMKGDKVFNFTIAKMQTIDEIKLTVRFHPN